MPHEMHWPGQQTDFVFAGDPPDWREALAGEAGPDDDDDEDAPTAPGVKAILGFDPEVLTITDGMGGPAKAPEQFGEDGGRWVTMGAHAGKDGGDAHGGTPVFIKDGKIEKGPAHAIGKAPRELGKKVKHDHGPLHPETGTKEGPEEKTPEKKEIPSTPVDEGAGGGVESPVSGEPKPQEKKMDATKERTVTPAPTAPPNAVELERASSKAMREIQDARRQLDLLNRRMGRVLRGAKVSGGPEFDALTARLKKAEADYYESIRVKSQAWKEWRAQPVGK